MQTRLAISNKILPQCGCIAHSVQYRHQVYNSSLRATSTALGRRKSQDLCNRQKKEENQQKVFCVVVLHTYMKLGSCPLIEKVSILQLTASRGNNCVHLRPQPLTQLSSDCFSVFGLQIFCQLANWLISVREKYQSKEVFLKVRLPISYYQ